MQFYTETSLWALIALFATVFLVQFFFQTWFGLRIFFYKKKLKTRPVVEKMPVSVVITARNEAATLQEFLPKILTQEYPEFEVIVVNDASTDDTGEILEALAKQYKNLYITNIPRDEKFGHSKKLALTVGIKAARFDWILLTDADCVPASAHWINSMQANFAPKNNFVLGYGAYQKGKGLLNKIIRTDTLQIAFNYLTFAMARVPYMGIGRNMAFRKSVFFEKKGFARHYKLDSGSDDLFVNEAAKGQDTVVELSVDSFTVSVPKSSFTAWIKQKRRHLTTGVMYKFSHKVLLLSEILSRLGFYILAPLALYFTGFHPVIISAVAIRFVLLFTLWAKTIWMLKEKDLWWTIIFFDLLMPIIHTIIHISNKIVYPRNIWR